MYPSRIAADEETERKPSLGLRWAFMLLLIFSIAFPKGGFRIGHLPITVGYILIAIFGVFAVFRWLWTPTLEPVVVETIGLMLPFQTVLIATVLTYRLDTYAFGPAVSVLLSLIWLPLVFLIFFWQPLRSLPKPYVQKRLKLAIRFVLLFGIFLFFLKTFTGKAIEIPLLTVNADDQDVLEHANNTRGSLFKLISTYNNGNILGVCLCMFLPIYRYIEKRRYFYLGCFCAFLTLSRTSWIGLGLVIVAIAIVEGLSTRTIIALGTAVTAIALGLPILLLAMNKNIGFLFSDNLGGRSPQLDLFTKFSFFPTGPVTEIHEITYASVYGTYGLIGLVTCVLFLLAPAIVMIRRWNTLDRLGRAASLSVIIYAVLSCADGAIMFIPVMLVYMIVVLIGLTSELPTPTVENIKGTTTSSLNTAYRRV
jgi:hypothetical protein